MMLISKNISLSLSKLSLISTLLVLSFDYSSSCLLHGSDTGICTNEYLPETYGGGREGIEIANKKWDCNDDTCMPFCGKWIANYYPPCIPESPSISIQQKDEWVQTTVNTIISNQIAKETNRTNYNEYKKRKKYFYKNKDCQLAYERFLCWLNFPRCDEHEETLPMCQSTCENFFHSCNYDKSYLSVCDSTSNNSNIVQDNYLFPGQPFQKNEFYKGGESKGVCTPSIKGSGVKKRSIITLFFTFLSLMAGTLLFL